MDDNILFECMCELVEIYTCHKNISGIHENYNTGQCNYYQIMMCVWVKFFIFYVHFILCWKQIDWWIGFNLISCMSLIRNGSQHACSDKFVASSGIRNNFENGVFIEINKRCMFHWRRLIVCAVTNEFEHRIRKYTNMNSQLLRVKLYLKACHVICFRCSDLRERL